MVTANKRLLEGRRIREFRLQPWKDSDGCQHHDPVIVLDNGAVVYFTVTESESEYGVTPHYLKAKK